MCVCKRKAHSENCIQRKINCFFFFHLPFRLILLSTKEISDYQCMREAVWSSGAYFPLTYHLHFGRWSLWYFVWRNWSVFVVDGKRTHSSNRSMHAAGAGAFQHLFSAPFYGWENAWCGACGQYFPPFPIELHRLLCGYIIIKFTNVDKWHSGLDFHLKYDAPYRLTIFCLASDNSAPDSENNTGKKTIA